jgi:hypothetical protein
MFLYNLAFLTPDILEDILNKTIFDDPNRLNEVSTICVSVIFNIKPEYEQFDQKEDFIFSSEIIDDQLLFKSLVHSNLYYHNIIYDIRNEAIQYYTIQITLIK